MDASDPTRVMGIFDDVLPARDALIAMGFTVRDDYDPAVLRSSVQEEDMPGLPDDGPDQQP